MWKPRKRHEINRAQLHDLVWSEPTYQVAERYGISGTAIAKICRKANIPTPERGYWNRVQAGKKVHKRPLKPAAPGKSETLFIAQGDGPKAPAPPNPPLDPVIVAAIAAESLEENRIVVPDTVARIHPDAKKAADATTRLPAWQTRNAKPEPIELRRRRIIDAFLRAVKQRGGRIDVENHTCNIVFFGSTFSIACTEPEKRVRVPMTKDELKRRSQWETRDYTTVTEPTGLLRMRIVREGDRHRDFTDTEAAPLETRLNDVMAHMFENCITIKERDRRVEAARVAAADAQLRAAEEESKRRKAERAREKERERIERLSKLADQWRAATSIRAFVDAAAASEGFASEAWLTWAQGIADKMDPLVSKEDPEPTKSWWENDDDES